MKNLRLYYVLFTAIFLLYAHAQALTVQTNQIDEYTMNILLTIPLEKGDALYSEYLSCSIDSPDITLSPWKAKTDEIEYFDPYFKKTKKIFNSEVNIELQARTGKKNCFDNAHLTVSYYLKSKQAHITELLTLKSDEAISLTSAIDVTSIESQETAPVKASSAQTMSWSDKISNLLKNTDSLWLRIVLVFLLGILMSLTPCIYPMIPITVGIIQSQASKSFWYNILLALSYTIGIAITFAFLGLAAAYTGHMFGTFLAHPAVVIAIVALLTYLAFSMIGFYEMHIPRFMQPKHHKIKGGSLISSFIFGIASGTFASPCLSPGLVLLLSIVTALKSVTLGFILLFSFGIGLSVPLLLVGSFSSSLAVLPRAGMWMIEIKKIFGFMMLGMCFYFLGYIIPLYLLYWMISIFIFLTGIFYLNNIKPHDVKIWRIFKNSLGVACIVLSVVIASKPYFMSMTNSCALDAAESLWKHNYEEALALAKQENKKLLIDVGAPFCSLCKAIDNTLFSDPLVISVLQKYIAVKIDGSDNSSPCNGNVTKKFGIQGFPTIILINPHTEQEIKRWGGELYGKKSSLFITELENAQREEKN